MILAMSSEATAASILVREWFPNISISFLGSVIIIGVTLFNLLGADKLSKLESSLAAVKLLAIVSFIILAILLIAGVIPRTSPIGIGELAKEPLIPGGIKGIAGSMLIVIFAYAGFEIISLAASETKNPRETVPKTIKYTVLSLLGFYILSVIVLLPLIPTSELSEDVSPMVAALNKQGIRWAGTAIKLPKVYLFLVNSGGFALLFTYGAIMATHIRFRKINGCPPEGKCQMPGYPYTSWIGLISMIIAVLSMPFIPGQSSGLIAGIIIIALYSLIYTVMKISSNSQRKHVINRSLNIKGYKQKLATEYSKELTGGTSEKKDEN